MPRMRSKVIQQATYLYSYTQKCECRPKGNCLARAFALFNLAVEWIYSLNQFSCFWATRQHQRACCILGWYLRGVQRSLAVQGNDVNMIQAKYVVSSLRSLQSSLLIRRSMCRRDFSKNPNPRTWKRVPLMTRFRYLPSISSASKLAWKIAARACPNLWCQYESLTPTHSRLTLARPQVENELLEQKNYFWVETCVQVGES